MAGRAVVALSLLALGLALPTAAEKEAASNRNRPAAVDSKRLDRTIDDVLSEPRFQWRTGHRDHGEEQSQTPIFAEFFRSIGAWIGDVFEAIADWLSRLRLLPPPTEIDRGPPGNGITVSYLLWGALVALAAVLAFLLWRRSRPKPTVVVATIEPLRLHEVAENESDAAAVEPQTWRTYATELAGQGKLREAMRAVHLAALSELCRCRVIRLDACKSNLDYLTEVRRRKRFDPRLSSLFAANTGLYETVWYGRLSVDTTTLDRALDTFDAIAVCCSPVDAPEGVGAAGRVSLAAVITVLALAAVAGSVYWLLTARFVRGDAFPPYSSLQSGPFGTEVFFEALSRLDGVDVRRHFDSLDQLPGGPGNTILLLGQASPAGWDPAFIETPLSAAARNGSRVVISFSALTTCGGPIVPAADQPEGDDQDPERRTDDCFRFKAWGLSARAGDRPEEVLRDDRDDRGPGLSATSNLPRRIRWLSPLVFTRAAPEWRVLYENDGRPVVLERPYGRGTIVVAGDSFFVSNQALLEDRHTELLAWLIGDAAHIVFDESHLGVRRAVGVVVLARRYRLHGFLIGVLALVVIFVWRTLTPVAWPAETAPSARENRHRTSGAALVSLLNRSLSDSQLLAACIAAWKRACARNADRTVISRVEQLQTMGLELGEGYDRLHREIGRTNPVLEISSPGGAKHQQNGPAADDVGAPSPSKAGAKS